MPTAAFRMRPVRPRHDPLPPARSIAPYAGMTREIDGLCAAVHAAGPVDDEWDVISVTGRYVKIPRRDGKPRCGRGVACALADLRDSMNPDETRPPLVLQGERLWHMAEQEGRTAYHPTASVQVEYGIPAAEHRADIEEYVMRGVESNPQARLVMGVKFANVGFRRTEGVNTRTVRVTPDDPSWDLQWALDLSDIPFDPDRVTRWYEHAAHVIHGADGAEMAGRVVAAPVAQPYMHAFAVLTGRGGNGKGSMIGAMAALYGPLAAPFSMAALLGESRTSSTTNDQATQGLLTAVMAYDTDSIDPGRGMTEQLKKASAGEPLSMRLLQQNVATAKATAFIVIATNHAPTLESAPAIDRRMWICPFRGDTDKRTVERWRDYLGDGANPDDGIIDALMAGCQSFVDREDDLKVASRLTDALDDYGMVLLDLLMTCGGEYDGHGIPDRARVRVSDNRLPKENRQDRAGQLAMMGLIVDNQRDVHGDGKNHQMILVKDEDRFEPFAEHWHRQQAEIAAEAAGDKERLAKDLAFARHFLLEVPPFLCGPGVAAQIRMLRSVDGLEGTLIVPPPNRWKGKGVTAHWRDDAAIRRDLRSCDLSDLPDRCALSVADDMLILDLDSPAAVDQLMAIPGMAQASLDTVALRSPHGVHLIYRLPPDLAGRVRAGTRVAGTMIDLRPGQRSYVVAPGSRWHDRKGDHRYPGVIRLPQPDGEGRRTLRMLPPALRKWLAAANQIEDGDDDGENGGNGNGNGPTPVPSAPHSAPAASPAASPARSVSMPAPPVMGPGATHDPLRDRAYRIVMTAKEQNWPRELLDAKLDELRDAVPAGHDPRDVEECIRSALLKAGFSL